MRRPAHRRPTGRTDHEIASRSNGRAYARGAGHSGCRATAGPNAGREGRHTRRIAVRSRTAASGRRDRLLRVAICRRRCVFQRCGAPRIVGPVSAARPSAEADTQASAQNETADLRPAAPLISSWIGLALATDARPVQHTSQQTQAINRAHSHTSSAVTRTVEYRCEKARARRAKT